MGINCGGSFYGVLIFLQKSAFLSGECLRVSYQRRKILLFIMYDGMCNWCRKSRGTTSHALIFCDKIRKFWKMFPFWPLLKRREGGSMVDIGGFLQCNVTREDFERWLVGMWFIWTWLCKERYEGKEMRNVNLMELCDGMVERYSGAKKLVAAQRRILPTIGEARWRCPPRGRLWLDVDYAANDEMGWGGFGAVVRDECGKVLVALAAPSKAASSIFMGELQAVVTGICQCIRDGLSSVMVFSDSLLVVHVVAEKDMEQSVLCDDLFETFRAAEKYCSFD